ncbi:hypothetical protein AVEN_270334-1 [Araneus ventricosus]|uniref:Uncharacterized protein n=1 Tax=Araneus ventricosus TaxID=182803 RepID=A0A4Y2RJ20_ARAVE|nr:hypothetical protein AVEN_270334-1 [Araneus ventricosus]
MYLSSIGTFEDRYNFLIFTFRDMFHDSFSPVLTQDQATKLQRGGENASFGLAEFGGSRGQGSLPSQICRMCEPGSRKSKVVCQIFSLWSGVKVWRIGWYLRCHIFLYDFGSN